MLQNKKLIKIEDAAYEVPFPNVYQHLEIKSSKIMYSNNTYDSLLREGTVESMFTLNLIDAISTFRTLIPELTKDMVVKDISDLDLFKAKKLVSAYVKQYKPWYNDIVKQLYLDDEEEDLEKDEE